MLHGKQSWAKQQRIHPPSGGQFLTLPDTEALFWAQQEEQAANQADEMKKKVEKEAASCSQVLKHAWDAIEKTFTIPLTSYKRKDDLKDIAAAFALNQTDTTSDLITCCQDHLLAHPDLQSNPWFTGLFSQRQTQHRKLVFESSSSTAPPLLTFIPPWYPPSDSTYAPRLPLFSSSTDPPPQSQPPPHATSS